jgi:protein-disulfide isomerase
VQTNKATLGMIAAAVIVGFGAAAVYYRPDGPAPANEALIRAHSPRLGPEGARVTIVEFFDPECEACRAMYPIVKQVMKEFDGTTRLVIRYMPLHGNSVYAASLLEAARAQNKYWEYLEVMMARQPEWASHDAPRPELLIEYAKSLGLDIAKLGADAKSEPVHALIRQDQADGRSVGALRTPTFFINGVLLQRLGAAELREAIQGQLK